MLHGFFMLKIERINGSKLIYTSIKTLLILWGSGFEQATDRSNYAW
jgi:hypothetical protein